MMICILYLTILGRSKAFVLPSITFYTSRTEDIFSPMAVLLALMARMRVFSCMRQKKKKKKSQGNIHLCIECTNGKLSILGEMGMCRTVKLVLFINEK